FSEYMNQWLYAEDGYYASYKTIGKEGDFYTSVSTSKFFGGSVALHIIKLIDEGFLAKDGVVCEIGAHHGYFLADVCEFIYTLRPELLQSLRFVIIERFDAMREFQKNYFLESFGDAVNLTHYKSLNDLRCDNAFFVANEIFDAFSCELYYKGKIGRVENHEVIFDLEDSEIDAKAKKYHKDRGEIALGYEEFAKELSMTCPKFEFMSFDYGEMQARPDISLRIYANHKVYPFFDEECDKERLFKNSDITYDVTFEHVKDAFIEAGVELVEFKSQMAALINMGVLELLEKVREHAGEAIYKQELDKVKTLIMPEFLGERFKMIRFRKC
ncbi:MAG: SAM-dependent methyltransferase, partial [Sulfurimonadaceae bacterium]|nr:SAM-dependent methyltransferase [Sulfurimonadaceae bacterium]